MAQHEHEHDPTVATLVTAITELRAALAEQQTAIDALQQQQFGYIAPPTSRSGAVVDAGAGTAPKASAASATGAAPAERANNTSNATKRATSRRGLLRGAAAAGAAAAVAAVAVGGAEQAHAAPLTTGGNFLLGSLNNADNATSLIPTSGTQPFYLLSVDNTSLAGSSSTSSAIYATSQSRDGAVHGQGTNGGTGIWADADGTGWSLAVVGAGRMYQNANTAAGAPTSGSYINGEQIRDVSGEMWLCTASGSPGTWVRVAHVAPGHIGGAITYLSKPIRLLDTRLGQNDANQNNNHTPCSSAAPTTVTVASVNFNGVQVPGSAVGAIGNVTVVAGPSDSSYLEVVPSGAGFTGAANLAYGPNQVVSNAFNVGLSSGTSSGALDIIIGSGSVNVIVDLFAVVA